jgi:hypothetical protein
MFGALRSMEGLATLEDVLANTNIRPWYDSMVAAVGLPSGQYLDRSAP